MFYGAVHTFDLEDKQLAAIDMLFQEYRPDLVILKGSRKINLGYANRENYFIEVTKTSTHDIVKNKGEFVQYYNNIIKYPTTYSSLLKHTNDLRWLTYVCTTEDFGKLF